MGNLLNVRVTVHTAFPLSVVREMASLSREPFDRGRFIKLTERKELPLIPLSRNKRSGSVGI